MNPRAQHLSARWVRHCFWKYPVISAVLFAVVAALAGTVGSPDSPPATVTSTARHDPAGSLLAFTQELDGTAPSWSNVRESSLTSPARMFVLGPLRSAAPLLGAAASAALRRYEYATPTQQHAWAARYDRALAAISRASGGTGAADMMQRATPELALIPSLRGEFGPVPQLTRTALRLAQSGYLQQYLLAADPGHTLQLVITWIYDEPRMLRTAVANGLTDDQWGMVKERGFLVGPWYLFLPALIHVKLPGGSTGTGFVLCNLVLAAFFLFAVPWLPGLRRLPERLGLYRYIYRYPLAGELDHPANAWRASDPAHGYRDPARPTPPRLPSDPQRRGAE